jgi:cis-3-alkyl-4-acyloxetan-2-one decarboxylase
MVNATQEIPGWLRAVYPFAPKQFITPAGAQMSYLDEGPRSAQAVLMLHGNPSWSFLYRNVVRCLTPSARCIAPDHIGMGLSEKPQDYDYTLERRIGDVEALVNACGVETLDLVVHDWGGAIGFGFATRHPERIRRIVIMNTAAFVSDRIPLRIAACRAPALGEWLVRGLNGFAGPAKRMTTVKAMPHEVQNAFVFPHDTWANRVAVHRFVQDIPMEAAHPSRDTLKAIEAALPALQKHQKLIVWGGQDFCFNDSFLDRWRSIYPDARVHRFADAGHYVLEDAGEDALNLIEQFLQPIPTT